MKFFTVIIVLFLHSAMPSAAFAQALEAQGPPPKASSDGPRWEGEKRYWQSRDPIADASDAIAKRDYRLFSIPTGWGAGSATGALCITHLSSPYVFERGMISDAREVGSQQPYYEEALLAYGARYNHEIISSPDYPLSDFCKSTPALYLNDAVEPTSFHPPSGPSDLSLIGAIRRGNKSQVATFIEEGGYSDRMFGMSPIAWAALRGDEDIFMYLYQKEKYKPFQIIKEKEKLSIVELAVLGGNIAIVDRLLRDQYEFSAYDTSHTSSPLIYFTEFLSVEMFEKIIKYTTVVPLTLDGYLYKLIRYNNLGLIFHMVENRHIDKETLLKIAASSGSVPLLEKYLSMVSMQEFDRDIVKPFISIRNDTVLNFLIDKRVSNSALNTIFSKKQEAVNFTLNVYKKLYKFYGIVPEDAIEDALNAEDLNFLRKALQFRSSSKKLSSFFKAKLYARSVRKKKEALSKLLNEFGITLQSIYEAMPCVSVTDGFSRIDVPITREAIVGLMQNPSLIMECHTPKPKMNISYGPTIDWRKIVPHLTKEQALILIESIVNFTEIKPLDKQYHLDSITAEFIRNKNVDEANEIIRQVYKAAPTKKTLYRLESVALSAPDVSIISTLFDLGLVPKFQLGFDVISFDGFGHVTAYDAIDTGQISKVKLYLDNGFDPTIVSQREGALPMYACLKLGIKAEQLFDRDNEECKTGLTLRALQDNISSQNAIATSKTLKLMQGKWEALRGWHQTFLKALIIQKLYGPLQELAHHLPSPDGWRYEKLRSKADRSGGLSDYAFWKRGALTTPISRFKGLISMAFKTDNIEVIAAVLKYYTGTNRSKRGEMVSIAAPYVTVKTYPLFIKALNHHNIPMNSHYLMLTVIQGSQQESLRLKDTKQLNRILIMYLNQRRIDDVTALLSQMRERDIVLDDIYIRKLSTLAESMGLYDLARVF